MTNGITCFVDNHRAGAGHGGHGRFEPNTLAPSESKQVFFWHPNGCEKWQSRVILSQTNLFYKKTLTCQHGERGHFVANSRLVFSSSYEMQTHFQR